MDDTVVDVLLDADVWAARACDVISRNVTPAEWGSDVPGDLPLQPVCGECS